MVAPHRTLAGAGEISFPFFVNNSDLFVRGNSKGRVSGFKIPEVLLFLETDTFSPRGQALPSSPGRRVKNSSLGSKMGPPRSRHSLKQNQGGTHFFFFFSPGKKHYRKAKCFSFIERNLKARTVGSDFVTWK